MRGLKLRGIVGLFLLILCFAGIFIADVYKQNTFIRLSVASMKLNKSKTQLRNELALLEVQISALKKYSRIESIAKNHFGLEYGSTQVVVHSTSANKSENKHLVFGRVEWQTKGL